MITLRRSGERHHVRRGHGDRWASFHAPRTHDGLSHGFGALERFDHHRLEPGASVRVRPARAVEVISYVLAGVVSCNEPSQRARVLRAGDFQRVAGGAARGLKQANPSRQHASEIVQMWLRSSSGSAVPEPDQRHFSAAERRGALRLVAARDAPMQALRLQQDVSLYSALLDPGQHLVHELGPRRSAWLHVLSGEVIAHDSTLRAGDAASYTLERAVSFTALMPSEVLLLDLAHLATAPAPT